MKGSGFLSEVLGKDGLDVLEKSAEKLPFVQDLILPRVLIALFDTIKRIKYEGAIPGTSLLVKSSSLIIPNASLEFSLENQFVEAVTAALVEVGGDDVSLPDDIDPKRMARLAKSVDLLTKARFLSRIKALEAAQVTTKEKSGSSEESSSHSVSPELEKGVELPGKAAPIRAPKKPDAPEPQKKQAAGSNAMKPPKPPLS